MRDIEIGNWNLRILLNHGGSVLRCHSWRRDAGVDAASNSKNCARSSDDQYTSDFSSGRGCCMSSTRAVVSVSDMEELQIPVSATPGSQPASIILLPLESSEVRSRRAQHDRLDPNNSVKEPVRTVSLEKVRRSRRKSCGCPGLMEFRRRRCVVLIQYYDLYTTLSG